jgi:hypothetical protein
MAVELSEYAKQNKKEYAKGFERGRKCYQNCVPIPRFTQYIDDPDKQIAYSEGLMDGYAEEEQNDCTTNFIYPEYE